MLLDEYTMVLHNPFKMQSTKCYWDVSRKVLVEKDPLATPKPNTKK